MEKGSKVIQVSPPIDGVPLQSQRQQSVEVSEDDSKEECQIGQQECGRSTSFTSEVPDLFVAAIAAVSCQSCGSVKDSGCPEKVGLPSSATANVGASASWTSLPASLCQASLLHGGNATTSWVVGTCRAGEM